jgi:hypothetical protein
MTRANGNGLAHRYGLLEPDERFRLALEAQARGDDVERERLAASCPMVALRLSDPDYLDRVKASHDLGLAVALELGPIAAQLRMLEVTSELIAHAGRALSDGADESPVLSAFATAADELRAYAAAVFQAFAGVCRKQLRLEPEVVLAAHLGPYVERFDLVSLKNAKPDRAAVRHWQDVYEAHWGRRQAP